MALNRSEAPTKIDLPPARRNLLSDRLQAGSPGTPGTPRSLNSPSQRLLQVPTPNGDGPASPSAVAGPSFANPTPLPVLPIIVLCLAMLGEFLSAATPAAFLFFMIEDFGVGGDGDEAEAAAKVAFWTGITGSVFFLSQFVTSLMWTSVAEKHGRRTVLFTSLLGNAVTLVIFGTTQNLPQAIVARLAMGVFNGAVGVARSAVATITDVTNEGKAVSYMALCWGLGGIVGSIIGGLLENPVRNYPWLFGNSTFFTNFPYLLPCLVSGIIVGFGAVLSLFLGPDGGSREGQIRLSKEEDDNQTPPSLPARMLNSVRSLVSSGKGHEEAPPTLHAEAAIPIPLTPPREIHAGLPRQSVSAVSASPIPPSQLRARRTSRAPSGVYGSERPRRFTNSSQIRPTMGASAPGEGDAFPTEELNFAERLVMANEPAIFNLADLWVANAVRTDDVASQMELDESVFEDEESRIGMDERGEEPDFFGYGSPLPSTEVQSPPVANRGRSSSVLTGTQFVAPSDSAARGVSATRKRRGSVASSMVPPAIFANTGLDPSSLGFASPEASTKTGNAEPDFSFSPMAAIPETGRLPHIVEVSTPDPELVEEKPTSLWRQLPLGMLAQYALLALHGTICDQVFMSFLVSPIPSGGLGLKAAHYALLTALMFFFSLIWQFRTYPWLSAPRGPLTHLGMFRLGIALYIPVYVLFPELRAFLRQSGNNAPVILAMATLSALRYLANTLCYTSVMILINAMAPPHLVPLANGLAQSAVSLCRFIGPIIGGSLWAISVVDGPNAHPWPFNYAFGFNVIGIVTFLGFLHSFRIR